MIDIHCHILPAVDDGSGNWSDSLEMARLAQLSKVSAIVATPHCYLPGNQVNAWTAQLEETLETLRAALRRARVPVALYPGQELFLARGALELLRSGGVIGLNRSRYLLVEFDMEESGRTAYRKLRQVAAEGYVPVVAHPERYGFVQEDDSAEFRLKEAGALIQINKGSFKGYFGRGALVTAHRILGRRLADFVASDAHSQYRRTTVLAEVHEALSERYSLDYADLLLRENPAKVIQNLEIARD